MFSYQKLVKENHLLLGKHVVILSANPHFKNVVENQLTHLKQIPHNLDDPDFYRAIPFGMLPKKITTIKTPGYILIRKLLVNDSMELVDPELAKAYKNKQLILSLWEGYQRQLIGRDLNEIIRDKTM